MSDIVHEITQEVIAHEITEEIIEHVVGDRLVVSGGIGPVVTLTEDEQLLAVRSGRSYNNTDATDTIVATLPPAAQSLRFQFRVTAAELLAVKPYNGDVIVLDDITITDAEQLECSVLYAVLDLECQDATTWIVTNIRREWAIA